MERSVAASISEWLDQFECLRSGLDVVVGGELNLLTRPNIETSHQLATSLSSFIRKSCMKTIHICLWWITSNKYCAIEADLISKILKSSENEIDRPEIASLL